MTSRVDFQDNTCYLCLVTMKTQVADRLAQQEFSDLLEAYRSGASVQDLAQQYGCSTWTIYRRLKKAGLQTSDKQTWKLTDEQKQHILDMHTQGLSGNEIARQLGLAQSGVNRLLRQAFGKRKQDPAWLVAWRKRRATAEAETKAERREG